MIISRIRVSNRAVLMPESPIRKLAPYAVDAKKRGIEIYHLNIGQPDIHTPKPIFEAIKNFPSDVLPYGPSQGLLDLRVVISEYFLRYDINIDPDDVFITTGGSEAIIFTFMITCDVGDEVLIPEPFYTNYNGFAEMAGIGIIPLSTTLLNGFRYPSREEIESKITSRTKAILVCSPNNPTGTLYTREELEMVAMIAREYNLFILSDEVYREFTFDNRSHTSILHLSNVQDRAIIMDSISKRFSACGARIGFLVSKNKRVVENALKFGQARLCPPTIEQYGAIAGFKVIDNFILVMRDEYQKRRDIVFEELNKIEGVYAQKPEGAFYTVARLPVDDAENFTKWMLTDFNVDNKTTMVSPANGFYATKGKGKDEVRIAFVLKDKDLRDAMKILKLGIEEYRNMKK
ncbi:pyridoxal phosphate-dependent aminotransferase [candidate division WOR-3 bacterium]|nr:pyridoxal phosphate-dependent aminotransferase [candidate division WOR-3 bacterium]MCK4576968.1 pyridoxal phosphate-dependent aminotransferase [candidate division WOR-3 bacterium]